MTHFPPQTKQEFLSAIDFFLFFSVCYWAHICCILILKWSTPCMNLSVCRQCHTASCDGAWNPLNLHPFILHASHRLIWSVNTSSYEEHIVLTYSKMQHNEPRTLTQVVSVQIIMLLTSYLSDAHVLLCVQAHRKLCPATDLTIRVEAVLQLRSLEWCCRKLVTP